MDYILQPIRILADQFINNFVFQLIIIIVTIYSLFGDDFRLVFAKKESDYIFMDLNILTLVIFSLEMLISCTGNDEYVFSFFFWVDGLCTLTMIIDLQPVLDQMTGRWQYQLADSIRVIRLVRILKLYKSANNAIAKYEERRQI